MGKPSIEIAGSVATITLNRPDKANVLKYEDLLWLRDTFKEINDDRGITVVQFRAEGKYFCSGFDISSLEGVDSDGPPVEFGDVVDALEELRPITVAAIQGGVFGGATDLCLACDFRIGTDAVQMLMPAVRLGLQYYQGGLERYVSRLGLNAAKRLFLTAEKIDARTMLQIGFLTEIVQSDQLDSRMGELTQTLLQMAPLPLLATKKHLNGIARGDLDTRELRQAILLAQSSNDHKEALSAWKNKTVPVFTGS